MEKYDGIVKAILFWKTAIIYNYYTILIINVFLIIRIFFFYHCIILYCLYSISIMKSHMRHAVTLRPRRVENTALVDVVIHLNVKHP